MPICNIVLKRVKQEETREKCQTIHLGTTQRCHKNLLVAANPDNAQIVGDQAIVGAANTTITTTRSLIAFCLRDKRG